MSKKADKRRHKRRVHEQADRQENRRQMQRFVAEQVDAARAAISRFATAASDLTVTPDLATEQLLEALAAHPLMAMLLADPDPIELLSGGIAEDAGSERATELALAVDRRRHDHPALLWLALSLADKGADPSLSESLAQSALDEALARPPTAVPDHAADAESPALDSPGAGTDVGDDPDGDGPGLDSPSAETEVADDLDAQAVRSDHQPQPDAIATALVRARWRQLRLGDALRDLRGFCARWPSSRVLMETRALLVAVASDPEAPITEDQRTLADIELAYIEDRTSFERFSEAVDTFIAGHPDLSRNQDWYLAEFLEEVAETAELGEFDEPDPIADGLVLERFWLSEVDLYDDDVEDDLEPDPDGHRTVLGAFAADPDTDPELARAARDWFEHVEYGLWLGDWDHHHDGALWVTDIVTRRPIFAAFHPDQLAGLPRWSVLVGPIAPVAGVWRSGDAMLVLDPFLADEAAESVRFVTERVVIEMAKEQHVKPPRPSKQVSRPRPHGVLSDLQEPMEEAEAAITAKVLSSYLARLVAMVEQDRHRAPNMRNTDGEPVEMITAFFPVEHPALLRRRLSAGADFESQGDGDADDTVSWMGREMTAEEAANSMAQFRAQAAQQGWGSIEESDTPRRWIRGILRFEPAGVRVEVNSRARLDAITLELKRLGAGDPVIESRLDPALDLPTSGARMSTGRSQGAEVDAAWMDEWITERIPALDGARPVDAARDPRRIVLLEQLLRQFEYDADVVAAAGHPPLDVSALRARLGLEEGLAGIEP
ncbi:MAG TPA: hypothetical protein VG435_16305 [Acidimicrobiales bacterium]|jgi:hypothetical protein|nr:hypothetical protein [Acidimicrobiales bacterium]